MIILLKPERRHSWMTLRGRGGEREVAQMRQPELDRLARALNSLLSHTGASPQYNDGLSLAGLVSSFLPWTRAKSEGSILMIEADDGDHTGQLDTRRLGITDVGRSMRNVLLVQNGLALEGARIVLSEVALEKDSVSLLEVLYALAHRVDHSGCIAAKYGGERKGESACADLPVHRVERGGCDLDGDLALLRQRVGTRLDVGLGVDLVVEGGFVGEGHAGRVSLGVTLLVL